MAVVQAIFMVIVLDAFFAHDFADALPFRVAMTLPVARSVLLQPGAYSLTLSVDAQCKDNAGNVPGADQSASGSLNFQFAE